jgi:hypothetical protein
MMMKPFSKDPIMYAAFMMEGLLDLNDRAAYSRMLSKWDGGCYELIDMMTDYIPFIERLVAAALADGAQYGGILEYEVCNPFGQWFGSEVERTGDVPIEIEAHAKLSELVTEYFHPEVEDADKFKHAGDAS